VAPSLKVAIVAGFYEPVRRALEGRFKRQLEVSSLVWIPQLGNGREPDLGKFGANLSHQLKNGAKHILVLIAILAGKGWVEECVQAIVSEAQSHYQDAKISVVFETKVSHSNQESIVARIAEFGIPEPCEITAEIMRSRLAGSKVLCVVMDGHTGFHESLRRAGFPDECICDEFFEHMVVPNGRNSNLLRVLHGKAEQYQHLLYAFTGLRTLSPLIKKRYSVFAYEGPTTRDVVNVFKRWLLDK
jgi:hypothetical protein